MINPPPADLVEQAALFRNYDSKEALARNLKGEKRSRSPSLPSSPGSFDQPLRMSESVQINSLAGAYFRGGDWQDYDDDDDIQRRIAMDIGSHRLIQRTATP